MAVPYDYPNLSSKHTATSPFVIVFSMAGSKVAGSFMNTVILTSVGVTQYPSVFNAS
jgi:AAT family amino acid transporter